MHLKTLSHWKMQKKYDISDLVGEMYLLLDEVVGTTVGQWTVATSKKILYVHRWEHCLHFSLAITASMLQHRTTHSFFKCSRFYQKYCNFKNTMTLI